MLLFWAFTSAYTLGILYMFYVAFFGASKSSFYITRVLHLYLSVKLPGVLDRLCPSIVQRTCKDVWVYLFHKRNRFYSSLFLVLQLLGFLHFLVEVAPLSNHVRSNPHNIRISIVCWLIHMISWLVCLYSDPGVITAENVNRLNKLYEKLSSSSPSNKLEKKKSPKKCSTCNLPKIDRSKHCSLCDKCVWRTDHHCIWINNCVAGNNTLAFHVFLSTFVVGAWYAAYTYWSIILDAANYARLWEMKYQNLNTMKIHPVDSYAVAQHMFKQFPRVVALGTLCGLLGVGVFFFLLFHFSLMLSNYTTREFCHSFMGGGHNCKHENNSTTSKSKTESETAMNKSETVMNKSETAMNKLRMENKKSQSSNSNINKRNVVVKHGASIQALLDEEATKDNHQNVKTNSSNSIVSKFTLSNSPYNYGFLLNILDAYLPVLCYQIRLRLKILNTYP